MVNDDLIRRSDALAQFPCSGDERWMIGNVINMGSVRMRLQRVPAVETAPQWISVKEYMPEDGDTVLTVDTADRMEVLDYDIRFPDAFCGCGGLYKVYNVTHWMPLPKLPESVT